MVSGQDPESMRSSLTDVAELMHRGQRRGQYLFAIRLTAIWVIVFIVTTVLVWIGIVVRAYVHSRTPSLQSLRLLGLLFGFLVGMEAILVGAMALATIRSQRLRRQHGRAREHLWTAAVHRLQDWFAVLPSPVWVAVLAVTAVLVIAVVVGRPYVDWPADQWEPTSSAQELQLLAAAAVLLGGVLARAALRRWQPSRDRPDQRELAQPEDVRVEPHTSLVQVTVEPVLDGTRTVTIRLEPHHDPGTQTLQEATP